MKNKVLLKVDNVSTYINGTLSKDLFAELRKILGYVPEDAYFMIEKMGRGGWDGLITTLCYKKCRCLNTKAGSHFPSGLLSVVRNYLDKWGIEYELEDVRVKPEKNLKLRLSPSVILRDYQKEEIVSPTVKMGRGIIKSSTGSGKTKSCASIIAELSVSPFIFFVPSIDLLEQAANEIEATIVDENGKNIEVGRIGGGSCTIKDINVMTVQTGLRSLGIKIKKSEIEDKEEKDSEEVQKKYGELKGLIENCKGFIADECQRWASSTCQSISDSAKNAYYRIAASATPFRDKDDDILIQGCFGKNVCDISASYLIDKGYLVCPKIYFIHVDNMKQQKYISYQEMYKKAVVNNSYRNGIISKVCKKLINEGRNVLILVNQIEHGNILQNLMSDAVFIHGSSSKKERSETIQNVRDHKAKLTISSSILDEGVDAPPWDALILCGSGKSPTRALQRVGRVIRPCKYPDGSEKKDAIIIDFMDECKYMLSHSKKRKKIYKKEPRFQIEDISLDKE